MLRTMKPLALFVLLAQSAAVAAPAPQDEPAAAPPGTVGTAASPSPSKGTEQSAPARRPDPRSPDVFVPTEEVSEDLSVSFPVDI